MKLCYKVSDEALILSVMPHRVDQKCNFYSASSYASAVFGIVILSVRPTVRPSITRVLCDEIKGPSAYSLTSHKIVFILVSWYQQMLKGDAPFYMKFALKVTHTI